MANPVYIHVVWAPNVGPIRAYRNPTKAHQHARSMLGADATTCEVIGALEEARIVHVVWNSSVGPVQAYIDPIAAHSWSVPDVEVTGCELADELPESVMMDLESDYDEDEVTPIELNEIDDSDP